MNRPRLPRPLISIILLLTLSLAASAATQFTHLISTHVSKAALEDFTVGGRAHGSGGLVMQGRTTFVLARGKERLTLSPTEVSLRVAAGDRLCVRYEVTCYALAIEDEFVKPLISWVLDGTETAFSNTEGRSEASRQMETYGLVRRSRYAGHFIAPQLDTTRLFTLLREADYALRYGVVEPLPDELVTEITLQFNRRLSTSSPPSRSVHDTWTNADYNTKYVTTLGGQLATTTGRPLRYYWSEYAGESALKVTDIDIYIDPSESDSTVVREIVQLYQTAAVLRTLADANESQLRRVLAELGGSV